MKQSISTCIIRLFAVSIVMVSSVTIWSDEMDVNWTSTWPIVPWSVQNNDHCAHQTGGTGTCWSICNGYIYRMASTMLYENITLTFDVNSYSAADSYQHKCIFSYSTDNSISEWTSFYEFETTNNTESVLNHTQTLDKTTENNVGIGIKIEAISVGSPSSDNCCYLSNVKLEGTTILSSNNFNISASFTKQPYSAANTLCQTMFGTDLATVSSFNLNKKAVVMCHNFCTSKGETVETCGCWIGLYRHANEYMWHWQDGTELTQYGFHANETAVTFAAPWHTDGVIDSDPNHPITLNASVRIGAVYSTWSWGDAPPSYLYYPMCNAPTPEPTSMPTTLSPTTSIPTILSVSPTETPTKPTPVNPFGSTTVAENVLKTSDISRSTSTSIAGKGTRAHLSVISVVIILMSSLILCGFIVTYYLKYQQKRNTELIENYKRQMSARGDCYVQLIDLENFATEGQRDGYVITPLETTRTVGESVTMEGDVVIPESIENDEMLQEKNTAGNFGQILTDNVVAVDLIMDDIIDDMDTNK